MDANRKHPKDALEAAIEAMRNTQPDRMDMENRSARVWASIGEELTPQGAADPSAGYAIEQIRNCNDYRSLIPDYIAGRLSPARTTLFKDHTHECVACRNALNEARGMMPKARVIRAEHRFNRTTAVLAVAAALIIGVVLQQAGYLNFLLPGVKVNAMARTIDGKLYRVTGLDMNPVVAGEALKAGEAVRTAANSRAVIELADGTRIEMRERSQLALVGAYDGVRVNLNRGSVIVEAAKQRDGHLYVATEDATVSVVGTIFAVSAGVKGSRVSVIEGEVRVTQTASAEQALLPGQQMTTTPSLQRVSIEQEISWSRNLDAHLALLRALADVNAFLRDRIAGPQLRFQSSLLPLVPADTVVYAAFPNITTELGQAYDLFRQKIDQNPQLKAWWSRENRRREGSTEPTLEELIAHARRLGSYLGEEIAVAVTNDRSGPDDFVVLANVSNSSGVLSEINAVAAHASGNDRFRIVTDPAQLASWTGRERGPVAYLGGNTLVLADSGQAIYNVIVAQQAGRTNFSSQPFYASINQAYSKGAGTLFAVDLASLFEGEQNSFEGRALSLSSIDRLVVEQKHEAGKTMTSAQLNFNGDRKGPAAWLAPAAPMGALEFVSPQAYGLASAVTKDASVIFDELLGLIAGSGRDQQELTNLQNAIGVDIRRDLVEPLGGEILFAMDGPFLPTPSWKVIVEVYDSARLQNTIERLVTQVNTHAGAGSAIVSLSSEAVNSQVYYRLKASVGFAPEIHYTYALGYLIAGPSRALVSQALQYQQSRSSIMNAAKFRSLMPNDGMDHCSAILYQNLTETASSIANQVPAIGGITPDQLKTLRETIELTPATLVCVSGEPDRIVMGYQGDLAFNVLMLGGLQSMLQTVGMR